LGLSDEDQKKPHLVIDALRKFYGASIGVSGERQKFLRLLQEDNESIASWETRVRNQGAQCEYEEFADQLMRDQFIAGLTSEALCVKLIGKGHRHRDSQTKVALRKVVEAAKSFEATTYANQLMKTARGNQEQVNFTGKQNVEKTMSNDQALHVIGVVAITKNQDNSIVPSSGKDAIIAVSSGIFRGSAEAREVAEVNPNDGKPTWYNLNKTKKLSRVRRHQHHQLVRNRQRNFSPTVTWFTREKRKS